MSANFPANPQIGDIFVVDNLYRKWNGQSWVAIVSGGVSGFQGYQGSIGSSGLQGAQGANGSAGAQGAIGEQGNQGDIGGYGAQGAQGAQGSTGAQGAQGSTGAQGAQGSNAGIVPRVSSTTSTATLTPDMSSFDMYVLTAQAVGLTIANYSGAAPSQGQRLVIRIKDNGTAQTINYGGKYNAIGFTLPTTTVISLSMYLGIIYNSDADTLDVVAYSQD